MNNINKIHYNCIILVIASNDTEYYINARKVWKKYMNINPNVKVFFVYEKITGLLEDFDASDIIYSDINNTLSSNNILIKTLRAMYAINKYYSYNYFIRTNISTFWNLNNINLLLDKCPKTLCYAGGHDLSPFLIYNSNSNSNINYNRTPYVITTPLYSGVCMIFTPDIIENILNNINKINYNLPDDIAIGVYMSNINCNTMTYSDKAYYENYTPLDSDKIVNEINKGIIDKNTYYRVKNENNREHTDLMIYTHLLKYIYNIELK
jgi:hypothetical protein